jgi:hypothetical protein
MDTHRAPYKLFKDAIDGYVAGLVEKREMLNSRYEDLKSGAVSPLTARFSSRTSAKGEDDMLNGQ